MLSAKPANRACVMGLPRLATIWLGGCAGCHMAFLDLDAFFFDLAARTEIVFNPIMRPEDFPERVDVCLVEGSICNASQEDLVRLIRDRSRILAAFGNCAMTGKVPVSPLGLDLVQTRPIHELVQVDYYLPGCPPSLDCLKAFLAQALELEAYQGTERKR